MNIDITFVQEYFMPLIALICLCAGYVVKNCTPINNKYLIPINMILGVILAMWINDFAFTPVILAQGLVSGWSATGMYEGVKNITENVGEG